MLHRYKSISIPCNKCLSCKLAYASQWGIRITHEASLHESNSFVTLTYDQESLPDSHLFPGGNLRKTDIQKFLKRLRKNLDRYHNTKIRYYLCGEYGEHSQRAHWHLIIFGWDFPDKTYWRKGKCNDVLYRSKQLEELWPFGQSEIGQVSNTSANYVAGYVTKKISGPPAEAHYYGRTPEFSSMSLHPGIGKNWYLKYHSDIYPSDQVIIEGNPRLPPNYYDRLHTLANPSQMETIKNKRVERALENILEQADERLFAKNAVKTAQQKLKKGSL